MWPWTCSSLEPSELSGVWIPVPTSGTTFVKKGTVFGQILIDFQLKLIDLQQKAITLTLKLNVLSWPEEEWTRDSISADKDTGSPASLRYLPTHRAKLCGYQNKVKMVWLHLICHKKLSQKNKTAVVRAVRVVKENAEWPCHLKSVHGLHSQLGSWRSISFALTLITLPVI